MAVLTSAVDPAAESFKANAAVYDGLLHTLRERYAWALAGGGEHMVQRHRKRGKIPVRDRIDLLVDPMSPFLELSPLAAFGLYDNKVPAAGVVTGIGVVRGVICMIIANDATTKGGSFFKETIRKHIRAQDIAFENGLPVVYLVDCGGANLSQGDEVFPDQDHFGGAFYRQCRMSAAGIPQIAAVFGECTAGGAYIPALSDEIVMTANNSSVHLGGPQIVKAAIKEIIDREALGGAEMHCTVSGVSDHFARDEPEAIAKTRDIVGALGRLQQVHGPTRPVREPLYDVAEIPGIVGADLTRPFDQREIVARIVDGSEFHEFKPLFGETLVCGFAHIHGMPVGILANNGVLFNDSSLKGAHFMQLCNQSRVPMLFLQNITGYMVGRDYEHRGITKDGAKMIMAVSGSEVPKVTLIMNGSFGAGNYGMSGRAFDPRFLFMWPQSQISVMGAEQAANVLADIKIRQLSREGRELSAAEVAAIREPILEEYRRQQSAYYSTSELWDDGILDPLDTRNALGIALNVALNAPIDRPHYGVFRM